MSKSKGIGRGGARKGAGRKAKTLTTQAKTPEVIASAEKEIIKLAEAAGGPASALVNEAFAALRDVLNNSPTPAPRVSAARAIILLAKEERAKAALAEFDREEPPLGKKAAAAAEAQRITSSPSDDWGDDLVKSRAN